MVISRSARKGPFVDEKLLMKTHSQKESGKNDPIKTWARACTIIPDFVGHTYMVHNGKTFVRVFVTEEMVGHKLGEFAPSRNYRGHGSDKKK